MKISISMSFNSFVLLKNQTWSSRSKNNFHKGNKDLALHALRCLLKFALMVVAAFPLAKIGLLLLKQLSKPVATIIKNRAKEHPIIRRRVIIPTGKVYRALEDKVILAKGEKSEQLTEEEAVELGANAIGEIVLFGILSMILLAEIARQGDKKAGIEKLRNDEMTNMKDLVLELASDVARLQRNVSKLESELKVATDVMQLEEASHTAVYDFDFLDIIAKRKLRFGKPKGDKLDESSPSW